MTSLMRSAESSVFCSRCWRWSRTLRYPSSAKIRTIAPSNSMLSLALSVCVTRNRRARVGSVSGMLQHRRSYRHGGSHGRHTMHDEVVFREDRQVLHRHAEQGEAQRHNHQSDGELGPLGQIVVADVCFKPNEADI